MLAAWLGVIVAGSLGGSWSLTSPEPVADPPAVDRAAAVHPELEFEWIAPQACPTREELIVRIQGLLGRPLGEVTTDPVRVDATIVAEGSSLRLKLQTTTAAGQRVREFPGQTCDVLTDTAALVVATALDPSLAFGPEPEPPDPEPPPESEPQPEPPDPEPPPESESEPEPPVPVEPSEPPLAGAVRAGTVGNLGPLPSMAPGMGAAAALLRKRLRIELGFSYWFPRRAAASTQPGAGGDIQLWVLSTRACWAPRVPLGELPLCGGIQAGPMRGDGRGLGAPASTRLPWVATELGAAFVLRPLSYLGVWIGADLVVPLTRPGFGIDDLGPVHRAGAIGGQAMVALEARFGPGRGEGVADRTRR